MDGWQHMSTAPRDGQMILVKRLPQHRPGPRRIHHEHQVVWVQRQGRGFWRSRTSSGRYFRDQDCTGWKPLEDGI